MCTIGAEEVRSDVLEQFQQGKIDVLVSTDLLSRGIDTTFVSLCAVSLVPDVEILCIGDLLAAWYSKGHTSDSS